MRSRWIMAVAAAAAMTVIAPAPAVFAHEGHIHKVMGTVTASDATHFELKTPSGEVLSIAVNAKTKVSRAKKKAQLADVQVGTRVVVEIGNGEDPLIAGDIKLGATSLK